MSKAKTLNVGLAGAARAADPQRLRVTGRGRGPRQAGVTLEDQVTAAQSRAAAAEARASQLEAAANMCTDTCQNVGAMLPR